MTSSQPDLFWHIRPVTARGWPRLANHYPEPVPKPVEDRSDRALRVVVLDHTAALGGAELALLRLLEAIDPGQAVVTVLLFSDGPLAERLRRAEVGVEILPMGGMATLDRVASGASLLRTLRNAAASVPFAVRLGRQLRALDPDVIHSTSLKADLMAVPAAWIARAPLVWHVHDRISPDYLPGPLVGLIRALARRVPRQVVVNSRATAETLPRVPNLTIAYPGLSPEQWTSSPEAHVPPDEPTIGILGRISPTKGQLVFVRAAARVLRRHPEVRFTIIGEPLFGEHNYARQVRAEVRALGIADQVEFAGFVDDPQAALDGLTACVHASPTPEPFGQVVVEAMSRGVPVIATEGGGIAEIIRPEPGSEPFGLLVPPDDPEALATAMLEVLDHAEAARARADRAWHSATERFAVMATAATIMGVWRQSATGR